MTALWCSIYDRRQSAQTSQSGVLEVPRVVDEWKIERSLNAIASRLCPAPAVRVSDRTRRQSPRKHGTVGDQQSYCVLDGGGGGGAQ